MQISSTQKPSSTLLVLGVILAVAAIAFFAFNALAYQSFLSAQSVSVSLAATVTAKGGGGQAVTSGAEFNVRITATSDGAKGCNYKSYFTDMTQIWSGYPGPCDENGYQNYIKALFDKGKIPESIYNALKAVPKFW